MKDGLFRIGFLRVALIGVAITMVCIIAVFGVYFISEKINVKGSATVSDETLSYKISVAADGKYTLKRATVKVYLYNGQGNAIQTITETVEGDDTVSKTVPLPEGYDQTGFVLVKYSLNNIYEIIVMCLCGAVLIYALSYFGISFVKRPEKERQDEELDA